MTKQTINLGTGELTGDGESIRSAFDKVNDNFDDLYARDINTDAQTLALVGDTLSISDGNSVDLSAYLDDTQFSGDYDDLTNKPDLSAFSGNLFVGNTQGDHVGSVFSNDSSTQIVDATNKIFNGTLAGNVNGNVDGDVTGSVFGDDSTLLVDGVNSKIVGDIETASLRTSDNNIALGNSAGFTNQGTYGIALGFGAGDANQGQAAISIGYTAGQTDQGNSAIAIGPNAGNTNQGLDAVAIGVQTGLTTQGASSVAIGQDAGQSTQGTESVAIGKNAGKTTQGTQSVAIGKNAGMTDQLAEAVAIGTQAGLTGQNAGAIAIGTAAGETSQGIYSIAVGRSSGNSNQGGQAVAVGDLAGKTDQGAATVAIGASAGQTTQGSDAIAIGSQAGQTGQGVDAIAIGRQAGAGGTTAATYVSGGELDTTLIVDDTTGISVGARIGGTGFSATVAMQPRVLSVDNGTTLTIESTSLSTPSGILTFNAQQFNFAVGIGVDAGAYGQQGYTVALGHGAGKFVQGEQAIAIGANAGNINQGLGGVAIGSQAGETNQDTHGIAVGKWAGRTDQANEAIAIGYQAGYTGQGAHAIAIGQEAGKTSQAAQSIVLNATGNILNNIQEDSFVVKPIRSAVGTTILGYDAGTGEITHNASIPYPANAGVVWDGSTPSTVDVALDRLASYTQDFAVSTDAHWADPNPAEITDAINRLAAAIYALNGNTGI